MSRFWGWFERTVLVTMAVMTVGVVVKLADEVFSTASQDTVEALSFGFNILALLTTVLIAAIFAGLFVDLVRWGKSKPLSDHGEWLLNCGAGLGAAAFVASNALRMSAPYSLNPELAEVQFIFGWVFVLVFTMKARPIRTALMLLSKRQERAEAAA